MSRIQIRVQGTLAQRVKLEKVGPRYHLVLVDPLYGQFPVEGLKLEIHPEGKPDWVEVTEHELIALLVSVP